MDRAARRIASELLLLLLVVAGLVGAWGLILAIHRDAGVRDRKAAAKPVPPAPAPPPIAERPASPPVIPPAPPEPAPPPPEPDRSMERLAELNSSIDSERKAADEASRKLLEIEGASKDLEARREQWRQREARIEAEVERLSGEAGELEGRLGRLDQYRDVLARKRDEIKQELVQLWGKSQDSFSILPYKGPNGTWRRPIAIECRNGMATIQPGGPSFSLLELGDGLGGFRSSPLTAVISRYVRHVESQASPDGQPVVPYILFVVRPDGIRPYYEARAQLEKTGLSFGYELVEQDWEIEFPDLDDAAQWSETAPLRSAETVMAALEAADSAGGAGQPFRAPGPTGGRSGVGSDDGPFVWRPREGSAPGRGSEGVGGVGDRMAPGGFGSGDDVRAGDVAGAPGGRDLPGELARGDAGAGSDAATGVVGENVASGRPGDPEHVVPGSIGPGPSPGNGVSHTGGEIEGIVDGEIGDIGDLDPTAPLGSLALEGGGAAGPGGSAASPSGGRIGAGFSALGAGGASAHPGAGGAGGPSSPGGMSGAGLQAGGAGHSAGSGNSAGAGQGSGAKEGLTGQPAGNTASGIDRGSPRIERDLELVVVCRADGVLIHPGGYRLTNSHLGSDEGRMVAMLKGIVARQQAWTMRETLKPYVKFLIEPGGQGTYQNVRRQTLLAGIGWPVRLQVLEGADRSLLGSNLR